jgi:DNA-binding response OmpR family regulator
MNESIGAAAPVREVRPERASTVLPHPAAPRVAVLDDDSGFIQVFVKRVNALGWSARVLTAPPPTDELIALRANVLLVDLGRLGPAGWDYLQQVSRRMPALAIVVCTEPSSVAQRVRGLRLGADDWVTKPCHPEEVLARIEAIVRRRRRADPRQAAEPVVAGELEVRADQFQAFVGGRSLELTRREFELLQLLVDARGRVLEREEIYQRVWGYEMARGDRSVDVFVRKLRQKLDTASPGWQYVHTHFGVGYRFEPQPS